MNKQIEEIARALCNNCAGKEAPCSVAKSGNMCKSIQREAEALYNAGYRKQSEGEWEKASEFMPIYRCSVCKERNLFKNGNNVFSNYCPNCGAKMKGGAER